MPSRVTIDWKTGFLATVVAMALNVPYLSGQNLLYSPNTPNINPINTQLFALSTISTQSPCFIGYNSDSGAYQTGTVNLQGGGVSGPLKSTGLTVYTANGQGIKNMTLFTPFRVGSATYFVAYDTVSGRMLFDLVTSVNQPCDTIANTYDSINNPNPNSSDVGPGISYMMPFYTADGTFLMTDTYGALNFYQITLDNNSRATGYKYVNSDTLGPAYTHLMPYMLNGAPGFFAYNAKNGTVQYELINTSTFALSNPWNLSNVGPGQDYWGTNWTHFVPSLAAFTPYFLRYSSITGAAEVDTILTTNDGIQTNTVLTTWIPGVTLFAPFLVGVKGDNNTILPDSGFLLYFPNGVATVWEF